MLFQAVCEQYLRLPVHRIHACNQILLECIALAGTFLGFTSYYADGGFGGEQRVVRKAKHP